MKITHELRVRATKYGIIVTRYTTKTELIRKIQRKEGNDPCFRTNKREYCQGCEWASDCKNALIAAWKR